MRLWHVATRRELFTLSRHAGPILWIQFASDTRLLVCGGDSKRTPCEVLTFPPAIHAALSDAGIGEDRQ